MDLALQLDLELDYEQRTYDVGYASWNDFLKDGFPAVVDFDNDRPVRWPGQRGRQVADLRHLLDDAGSTFTTTWSPTSRLIRRVDPTAAAAVEQTIYTAPPPAGDLLRQAWNQAYGLHPDPTTAYRDAVRAVEAIACPLVLDKAAANNSATLGKVRDHLRDAPHKWQFVLLARDGDGSVEPLVAMLDRLWTGQVSRHAGGQNSRDQTPEEARAAVHLAATLVQLLGAGALTQRGNP